MTNFYEFVLSKLTDTPKTSRDLAEECGLEFMQIVRLMANASRNGRCVKIDVPNPVYEEGSKDRKTIHAYTKAEENVDTVKVPKASNSRDKPRYVVIQDTGSDYDSFEKAKKVSFSMLSEGKLGGRIIIAKVIKSGEVSIKWK